MSIASTTPGVRRVRHAVRTRMSEHPAVYLRFARRKYPGPSPEVIGADTELVIEGYTRSASTFAVYALQLAQERPVRLAHHLHAPAQLIEAARFQRLRRKWDKVRSILATDTHLYRKE